MGNGTIELKNVFGICRISLVGAQVTSWIPSGLVCCLSATNVGSAPFEASDAFHPYFSVRDIEKCHVDGDPDFVTRPAHLSRYLPGDVASRVLSGTGIASVVRISGKGHSGWWCWNSGEDQTPTIASLASDDWRRFVCVEPVTRDFYRLGSGETRTIEMKLEII